MTGTCLAEDGDFVCPPVIRAAASIESLPLGWSALNPDSDASTEHFLEYAVFTDGHPRDLAYLRPVREEKIRSGGNEVIKRIFDFTGAVSDSTYLVCSYARTTEILLKPIGKAHRACEVLSSEVTKTIESIGCRRQLGIFMGTLKDSGAILSETTPDVQNPRVEAGLSGTLWSLRIVPITPPCSKMWWCSDLVVAENGQSQGLSLMTAD